MSFDETGTSKASATENSMKLSLGFSSFRGKFPENGWRKKKEN